MVYAKSEPPPYSEVVGLCLRDAQIIEKQAGFDAFLRMRLTRISRQ
jgi:hypothetical protein